MHGPDDPPPPAEVRPTGPDADLEALLREQDLLALPPAVMARLLDAVLPAPRMAPWALAGRVAATVLVLFASWLAAAGTTPAMADILPVDGVVAAVPAAWAGAAGSPPLLMDLPVDPLPTSAAGAGAGLWIALGALVLAAGLVLAWRTLRRGKDDSA